MSEHIRLAAIAGSLFVMSYIGVAWVIAGTPVANAPLGLPSFRIAALPSAQPAPAHTGSLPVEPPQPAERSLASSVALVQPAALPAGDGHPQRDQLRAAALQASAAYALAPCDKAAKAAMIDRVSAYAQAWADMMGCGPEGCDYRKINATAAVFSTPLDMEAREAVGIALGKRGMSIDDFPWPLRTHVAMLMRGRATPTVACDAVVVIR